MEVKLIKTELDYTAALARIDELFDITSESKYFDEVELLLVLVELYEQKHYQIDAPDPIEAIKFRMEQMGIEVENKNIEIPEEHKNLVRERIKTAKQEDYVSWEDARKQLKFKTKSK